MSLRSHLLLKRCSVSSQDGADTWDEMFSRGIDPDVLDPSKCHGHPNAPPEWPSKSEIIKYSLRVCVPHSLCIVVAVKYAMMQMYLSLHCVWPSVSCHIVENY